MCSFEHAYPEETYSIQTTMKSTDHRHDQEVRIQGFYQKLQLPRPPRQPGERRDLDAEEKLLRYLLTIEEETTTTYARQLIEDGIELPPPDSFTEDSVADKLWEVIHGLAHRRTFLSFTDHLSDLELYRLLWKDILNRSTEELDPEMETCAYHLDLLSDGSEESLILLCRYYDDPLAQSIWQSDFPDRPMPEAIDPPCRRDRHLPKPFQTKS